MSSIQRKIIFHVKGANMYLSSSNDDENVKITDLIIRDCFILRNKDIGQNAYMCYTKCWGITEKGRNV